MAYTEQDQQTTNQVVSATISTAGTACSIATSETGVGPLFCGAAVAIAKALQAFGNWVTGLFRDTFHPDKTTSAAFLTLFGVHPALTFLNIDKAQNPIDGSDLVRYFRIVSGAVPAGVKGNNPNNINNPYYDKGCADPYQCREDPDEPLTSPNVVAVVDGYFKKWVASGGGKNIEALPTMVPSLHRHPADAKSILSLIRTYPKPFKDLMAWSEITDNLNQIQEQLRAMRILAGEDGPDPGGVLSSIFGGDFTVSQARQRSEQWNYPWQHFYPFKWDASKTQWVLMTGPEKLKTDIDYLHELVQQGFVGLLSPRQRLQAGLSGKTFVIDEKAYQVNSRGMLTSANVSAMTPDQRVKAGYVGKQVTIDGLKGHIDPQGAFVVSTKKSSGPGAFEDKTVGYAVLGGVLTLTVSAFVALFQRNHVGFEPRERASRDESFREVD